MVLQLTGNTKAQKSQKQSESADKKVIKSRKRWNKIQTQKYMRFVFKNQNILQKSLKREKQYIFNSMQHFIKTNRDSRKCKSHHQKMIMKYKSIDKMLEVYYGKDKLQELRQIQKIQRLASTRTLDEQKLQIDETSNSYQQQIYQFMGPLQNDSQNIDQYFSLSEQQNGI